MTLNKGTDYWQYQLVDPTTGEKWENGNWIAESKLM